MSARLSNKFLPFLSIPLILSYYFSWLSFFALIPLFYYFEKKEYIKPTILTFLPFLIFIYSGIYKGTHVYYGLFFALSIIIVLLISLYQFTYLFLASYVFKKSNLPLPFFSVFLVAFEFLKNKLFYGMPLGNLNILTYNLPFFIKDASLFGSLFIDLKIILINMSIFYLTRRKPKPALFLILPFLVLYLIPTQKPIKTIKTSICVVQGNIPQQDKWKENLLYKNLERYLNLSKKLKADIVIWPESAYPYLFDPKTSVSIEKLIDNNTFALLFGALTKKNNNYFNSVVFYTKNKIEYYNKRKLVPFAEFIPFAKLLGLEEYNFSRGKKGVIFRYEKLMIAPLICYEENFPSLSRDYKRRGANLLVVLTNDAWFDKTPTFWLFPRSDIYRALENKIWLIRSGNTGLSFVVDPNGKIRFYIKPDTTGVLKLKLDLSVYPETFYDRYGWLFGYIILILAIFLPLCKKCKTQTNIKKDLTQKRGLFKQ